MQALFETVFDVLYLATVITLGILMIRGAKGKRQITLFGIMAVMLGCGDAFHLLPRSYALLTSGLEANAAALGIGKLVTSITMTIFYVILYQIWRIRYRVKSARNLNICVYALALIRIALCCFPQNKWIDYNAPLSWGIYRNIPFAILGILMILLFFSQANRTHDKIFSKMWLAITLSFAFYVPVVLFADTYPLVGMLMIPKTLAYVWIVTMGFREMKAKVFHRQKANLKVVS